METLHIRNKIPVKIQNSGWVRCGLSRILILLLWLSIRIGLFRGQVIFIYHRFNNRWEDRKKPIWKLLRVYNIVKYRNIRIKNRCRNILISSSHIRISYYSRNQIYNSLRLKIIQNSYSLFTSLIFNLTS